MLCCIAKASRGGYYKWLKQGNNQKDEMDYLIIKEIFEKGKRKLGWRPIQVRLNRKYRIVMNHKKIKRIMKKYGLVVKIRRKNPYKDIVKKNLEHRTCGNLLSREFRQTIPGKVLSTDITYLYYGRSQRAYLSVVKDIASKEILSWKLSNNLTMTFVLDSLDELWNVKLLNENTIIHSDQGFHYTNPEYIKKVKELNIIQSMSRKGNCLDNAPIESFFGHLKDDVDYGEANNFNQLNDIISDCINYYNNERYQWDIKKMTPVEYRNHLLSQIN